MEDCPAKDIGLKSFFLGPQSENALWVQTQIQQIFSHWFEYRRALFPQDGHAISYQDQQNPSFIATREAMGKEINNLIAAFEEEAPKFTPRYIGHMISEISLPGLFGHILTLLHNPNNASPEVAIVGRKMERKAVSELLTMIGIPSDKGMGHFTSGGTIANFEGLRRAQYRMAMALSLAIQLPADIRNHHNLFTWSQIGWKDIQFYKKKYNISDQQLFNHSFLKLNPHKFAHIIEELFKIKYYGPIILVPDNKHYSWIKATHFFGLSEEAFWPVELDHTGQLCVDSLKKQIKFAHDQHRPILSCISVAGTTELGGMDPIHSICDLFDELSSQNGWSIWHHIDAAYGGFFTTLLNGQSKSHEQYIKNNVSEALKALKRGTSISIDPHKLGYIPYSCGVFLCCNEDHYQTSPIQASYVSNEQDKKELDDIWAHTLEGSRSATGAVATWLSARTTGLHHDGLGKILAKGILAKEKFLEALKKEFATIQFIGLSDTNILCFCFAKPNEPTSTANKRTFQVYREFLKSKNFAVSKTRLSVKNYHKLIKSHVDKWDGHIDTDELFLIRMVFMNPFIISKQHQTDFLSEFIDELKKALT